MLLSGHSVGIHQEKSLHTTRQGTLCHSRLSSLSHCGLILAYRVEIVCMQVGNDLSNILPKSSHMRKKPTTTTTFIIALSSLLILSFSSKKFTKNT